jgi:hypothetical protein
MSVDHVDRRPFACESPCNDSHAKQVTDSGRTSAVAETHNPERSVALHVESEQSTRPTTGATIDDHNHPVPFCGSRARVLTYKDAGKRLLCRWIPRWED